MTCRSFRKSLPLFAGGDVGGRKAERARAHLAACAACRRDAAEFEAALETARSWARTDDAPAWAEAEWRAAVRSATASATSATSATTRPSSAESTGSSLTTESTGSAAPPSIRKAPRYVRRFRPVLAYSLLAVAVVGASVLLKPRVRPTISRAGISQSAPGPLLRQPSGPHLTSVRFAAKGGRLEVVWFFNRNFPMDFYGK